MGEVAFCSNSAALVSEFGELVVVDVAAAPPFWF